MKKHFYLLALATALSFSAKAQFMPNKAERDTNKAKAKYEKLKTDCYDCEQKVINDSIYGAPYKKLQADVKMYEDSVKFFNTKYDEALKILADEIARNPYNTADERKAYKNRRTEIEKRRQAEIDAMQNKLKASYEKLAREQKTYYGLMVNRKIENSINTK